MSKKQKKLALEATLHPPIIRDKADLAQAIKTNLNPEQQRIFDEELLKTLFTKKKR